MINILHIMWLPNQRKIYGTFCIVTSWIINAIKYCNGSNELNEQIATGNGKRR